ncbi:uncharacterized protein LOC125423827 [Ziziphus jujuba]|uniref:Uncharacterized protein LOC125423827 n=1 Tax=Ziziphus jujuba TaxID=326968 RepID=A0ABM3ITR5_ZIZJJ|nr:uncharacterized protein LOC125423827 [Ziziphus jujuba]
MSVLASPLEPLAFDFVSFGFFTFVNNLWTWLALITAALSFWRLRAAGSNSSSSSSSLDSSESSNGSTPPLAENTVPEKEPTTTSSPAAAPVAWAVPSRSSEDHEGVVTKGIKFTVYYENDDEEEEEEEEEGDGELTVTEEKEMVEVDGGGEWWESWERMLKMRSGEICWYRYQDMTEINGNVVRLWDAC